MLLSYSRLARFVDKEHQRLLVFLIYFSWRHNYAVRSLVVKIKRSSLGVTPDPEMVSEVKGVKVFETIVETSKKFN